MDDVLLVDVFDAVVVLDAFVDHGHVGVDVPLDAGHLRGQLCHRFANRSPQHSVNGGFFVMDFFLWGG